MTRAEALDRGRSALRRQAWGAAWQDLSAADREAPLDAAELEALAGVAHLVGRHVECAELLTRAHQGFLSAGDVRAAARCAFWLSFGAFTGGEPAQGMGWMGRARRLLEDRPCNDCVEQGYLAFLGAMLALQRGDAVVAEAGFLEAIATGRRFGDATLVATARHGQGRSRIRQGDVAGGAALLDEAMAAVQAGEVVPRLVGGIYCSVLEACGEMLDLRRAQEWTDALGRWCAAQPDVVPYRGHCRTSRAELLQLHGAWDEALVEAQDACSLLARPRPGPALGAALHLLGDLHRLRGAYAKAEEAYRRAGQLEPAPRPGLALLRLAQGQVEAARALIRDAAGAARGGARPATLDAAVEIALAARDHGEARAAADELAALARRLEVPLVRALAARAAGAVLLAAGDAAGARAPLREALAAWQELGAPYEAARVQVLCALACRLQGNREAAEVTRAAARSTFERLGARPAVAQVDALFRASARPGGLTAREVQVLALVASGRTNKAIAAALGLSVKTVARHLSNIFAKLELPSRAAATAYAFQHDLV
jgi:DNA-binding NarL/FixJ family response regulator